MFKKIAYLFLCLTLVISLTGCTKTPTQTNTAITLTDQLGREVTLDKPAEKIVSCYYITTYASIALGLEDELVGIENKANARPIYSMAAPELLDLPQVGTLKELNIEAVANTEPELVIMPVKLKDNIAALEELGIKVLAVNPETHDDLVEMLELIGKACGVEANAKALVDYYETKINEMKKLPATNLSVYMGSNSSYLKTAPGTMYQSQLIEVAGGNNVAKDLEGNYWTEVSYETLLKMNPDVIVVPVAASYTADDIYNDPQLSTLKAVQNKQVYSMPTGIEEWDSPIPSGILGTMWLASVLHDETYPFDEFKKDVTNFYSTFYGFEIDQTLITK